jgi:hypothetical protein
MTAPARIAASADALTAWLNDPARNWSLKQWTAERTWEPELDLTEAAEKLNVEVSADSRASQALLSRGTRQRDMTLFIDFRQKYVEEGPIPQDWIDERVGLVEAVDDALQDLTLTGQPTGYMVYVAQTTIDPVADRMDLDQLRQWTSTIEVVLRELKPR